MIVAAGGFAGGAKVQKSQAQTTAAAGPGRRHAEWWDADGRTARHGRRRPTGDATTGTVAYTKGNTLYVKDAEGNTVKVKVKSSANVTAPPRPTPTRSSPATR